MMINLLGTFYAAAGGCHTSCEKIALVALGRNDLRIKWKRDPFGHCYNGSGSDDNGLGQGNTNQDGERRTGSRGVLMISDVYLSAVQHRTKHIHSLMRSSQQPCEVRPPILSR